jgi:hypothetical protein
VNWVKALQDICANMTQYRVNARNCEAKRLHIGRYVACEFAHVCPARQRARDERRECVTPKLRLLEARDGGRQRAAPCPHKLGCGGLTMANCDRSRCRLREQLAFGASGVFRPMIDTHPFFSH